MRNVMRVCLGFMLLINTACDIPSLTTVLATVGQESVSRQDVVYRIGIAKSYGHKQPMNETALVYMIDDALTRQVATKLGIVVTKQDVNDLSEQLDKHSKTPKILNAVKWVFGDNVDDYRRVYLMPRIINRKLQDWYARHVSMQQRTQAAIEKEIEQSTAGQGKGAFDIWFRQQAQTMPVRIKDEVLRAGVHKKFPAVWWLNGE